VIPWTIRRWLGLADPEPDDTEARPTEPVVRPPNSAWNHELAMALRASPDDEAAWSAYADWLTANNDPRGAAMRGEADIDALVDAHPAMFLGPLAMEDGVDVAWRRGFWDAVTIERAPDETDPLVRPAAALVDELVGHASALLLRRLVVRAPDVADVADVLADGEVLPLRALVVDVRGGGLLGTWGAAWPRLPALARLEMTGDALQVGDMALPALEHLVITGRIDDGALHGLSRMHAPKLESLVLDDPRGPLRGDSIARLEERFGDRFRQGR
jgi:uncharacterized protein (TIGR02996 family)